MKNSYLIIKEAIDANDYTAIHEYLDKSNKALIYSYDYVFENKEDINQFFQRGINEIINEYYDCNPDGAFVYYYKNKMVEKVRDFVKSYNDRQICDMFNRYIEKSLLIKDTNNSATYITDIEKIDLFFIKTGIDISLEMIEMIFSNNEILRSYIQSYINSYLKDGVISYDKVFEASSGVATSMLLELYCDKNSIKIEKVSDDNNKNKNHEYGVAEYKNLNAFDMYLEDITKVPLLTPLEEILLFRKYHSGDIGAKNKIIEANLRFVVSIAKNYLKSEVEILDLIQYGNLGLYEAIDRFNEFSGYKFSTYAIHWIKQSISSNIVKECGSIKMPYHIDANIKKYNTAKKKLELEYGHEPETVEIADYLGWSIDKVINIQVLEDNFKVKSLNVAVNEDEAESNEIGDFIPSNVLVEEQIVNDMSSRGLQEAIAKMLDTVKFTDKEKQTILYRFGFITGRTETLEFIAGKFNVTRERVRQLEAKALRKMRSNRMGKELAYYFDDPSLALKNLRMQIDLVENGKKQVKVSESVSKPKVKKKTHSVGTPRKNTLSTSENNKDSVPSYVVTPSPSNVMSFSDKEKFLASHFSSFDSCKTIKDKVVLRNDEYINDDSFDEVIGTMSLISSSIDDINIVKTDDDSTSTNSSDCVSFTDSLSNNPELQQVEEVRSLGDVSLSKNKKVSVLTENQDANEGLIQVSKQEEVAKELSDDSVEVVAITDVSFSKRVQSLKELFDKIPSSIQSKIISELADDLKLSNSEVNQDKALLKMVENIELKLIEEAYANNIPVTLLEEYGIKIPDKSQEKEKVKKLKNNVSLEEKYAKVDEGVLSRIVLELTDEQQQIVKKRRTDKLTEEERRVYFGCIIPKVENRIALLGGAGEVSLDVLEEYGIKPKEPVQVKSLSQTYDKVNSDILEKIVSELTKEQQRIVKMREDSVKLDEEESRVYYMVVVPKVKYRIAREAELGNIPMSLLEEYGIKRLAPSKKKRVSKSANNISLKEKYAKIDGDILDRLVLELKEEQQRIVKKRETSILTEEESKVYFSTIIPNINNRIAREVAFGNIPESLLEEYRIKPAKLNEKGKLKKCGRNLSLKQKYEKISEEILDRIVSELSEEQQRIVKKREGSSLTKEERGTYFSTIIPSINYRIAREVALGNIPEDLLDEYGIKPVKLNGNGTTKRSVQHLSLKQKYEKISEEILDNIILELTETEQRIVKKRETEKLTKSESNTYFSKVMPKVKAKIIREAQLGNIPASLLDEYGIKIEKTNIDCSLQTLEVSEQQLDKNKEDKKSRELEILKARLLTLVNGGEVERLDEVESTFYNIFDQSYLTSDLNPKMLGYIVLRFGYLDGNNYSDKTISRVLLENEISACKENISLYVKYEALKENEKVDNSARRQKVKTVKN